MADQNVFLVTVGEYSDYRVLAVFSEDRKVDAEQAAILVGGDIEEMTLNPEEFVDPGMDYFRVYMRRSGESRVNKYSRLDYEAYELLDDTWGNRGVPREMEVYLLTHKDRPLERRSYWQLCWYGYAASEEEAVRIANELRRQILAGQRPEGVDYGEN